MPLAVVRAAAPYLLEAKRGVCGPRGCVLLVHLERCRGGVQHVRVVADARHEPGRDAPATPVARDDDVSHLEVVARELAAREADDDAEVVRDPPAAAGLRELVVEHVLGPRRVGRAHVGLALERRDGRQVVDGHGAQLEVPVCQRVVHAGDLDARGRLQAQALALVLLRVREARVDGQHQGRVAAAAHGRRRPGAREPLRRGVPQRLVQHAREAGRLEAVAVLLQAVARERELGRVRAGHELLHGVICRDDALRVERAVRARVVQQVDAGVDLAAHRVVHHGQKPALAGGPRAPRHGVQGRRAKERATQTAREALCRRDAYAHARERPRAPAHEHGVHVAHRKARL